MKWYLIGSDIIRMEKEFDIGIKEVDTLENEPLQHGDTIHFRVKVKNFKKEISPRFRIRITDVTSGFLNSTLNISEWLVLSSKEEEKFTVSASNPFGSGERRLKFEIITDGDCENTDSGDDLMEKEFIWKNAISYDMLEQIGKDIEPILKNTPGLVHAIFHGDKSPAVVECLRNIIDTIQKHTGKKKRGVAGILADVGGSYIVGARAGVGIYVDAHYEILCAPSFSGGVIYGVPGVDMGLKLVLFPWADSMRDIEGPGVTVSANIDKYSVSITNFDKKTVCGIWTYKTKGIEFYKTKYPISASFEYAYLQSSEAQRMSVEQFKSVIDKVNAMDLRAL